MKGRLAILVALLAFAVGATPAWAQVETGSITGRVTDNSGAILPGATVTVSGPSLIQPLATTTSETGTYQFPRVPIGTYTVKFELTGFKSVVREGVRLTIGFSAQIDQGLEISAVQETVTVSGETPVVDTKSTTARSTFDLESLQSIPSARDPWVMLERTPAITMDRINVGGSQSGQQSGYVSRGNGTGNNKWSLDGVDITDMSATGASPIYYDFDMLQEMQVTTGGADASQQTGGVGINFVTRGGTNRFRGSSRLYNVNDRFQADNVTTELLNQGAGAGNPIQNINDLGFEVGGPIRSDKLWYWGSYGKQDIEVGVVGFYLPGDTCRPPGVPLADIPKVLDTETLRGCLATDLTTLNNYNGKLTWSPKQNNRFNFQNTWAEKVRNARDASDTRPLETAYRQKAVDKAFGPFGWETGPSPIWKASDQHIFSDRLVAEIQYAHVGNNFTLTFQDPAQALVQPRLNISSGIYARSFNESVFLRPTDSIDLTTTYFLPSVLGGDHSFKAGYRWRTARGDSINHTGGNVIARFSNTAQGEVPNSAEFYRDGYTSYDLDTHALYLQDTFTLNRMTLNLGIRWDRQTEKALATDVPANPLIPNIMPAIDFPGVDPGVVWNDISPRLGLNYDLFGNGKSIARTSYSMYFGQMAPGQLSGQMIAVGQVNVRYGWNDANRDELVQVNEVDFSTVLARSGTFNPASPANFLSPGVVDPNIKNDRTREFIAGYMQELGYGMGFEINYIWRKYDQFAWADRPNWDPSVFQAVNFTPSNCTAQATCGPITYYRPTATLPTAYTYTNTPDRYRNYNGFELSMNKRYTGRWMAGASFAFNDAKDYWDSTAAYEDPTNIALQNGADFAPESGGSGIDSVFTSAKWLFKINGMYTMPWEINVAANSQYRQGYPFPQSMNITNRGGSVGDTAVLIDTLGETRLPDVFVLDLKVEKSFTFGQMRIIPSMDVFNVTNSNTVQSRRRNQYTYNATTGPQAPDPSAGGASPANANYVSSIVSPRVLRFGVRVTW